jgi:hypothetical protein
MFGRLRRWLSPPRVDLSCVDPRFLRRKYTGVAWSLAELQHFCPVGCYFESCRFEDADMLDACFGGGMEDTVYLNCSFDRSTIEAVAPGNARFVSCSFRNINIVVEELSTRRPVTAPARLPCLSRSRLAVAKAGRTCRRAPSRMPGPSP